MLFTQRREFQGGEIDFRPGGLLSFRERGEAAFHNLLVLHAASGTSERKHKLRQKAMRKIWRLRRALAGLPIQGGEPRLIAAGDINTMCRSRTATRNTLRPADEIAKLDRDATRNQMTLLPKSSSLTERTLSGSDRGDLDDVIASNDLDFVEFTDPSGELSPYRVEVGGWVERTGASRTAFIRNISDHCSLFFEVE